MEKGNNYITVLEAEPNVVNPHDIIVRDYNGHSECEMWEHEDVSNVTKSDEQESNGNKITAKLSNAPNIKTAANRESYANKTIITAIIADEISSIRDNDRIILNRAIINTIIRNQNSKIAIKHIINASNYTYDDYLLIRRINCLNEWFINHLIDLGISKCKYNYYIVRDAIDRGCEHVITRLMNVGYSFDICNGYAINAAIRNFDNSIIKMLLDYGVKLYLLNNQPLVTAIDCNNLPAVKLLLKSGADPKCRDNYPIIKACEIGNFGIVRELITYGVSPACRRNKPIRTAAEHCHTHVVKYLISVGADADHITHKTPGSTLF